MSENPSPAVPNSKPPRRRRFRWYTRLTILLVCLVIATVVIAQVLFWTDVPRRIVESQISSILRVDAKLGSLRIGWLGHIRVRDLVLRLPTEEQPFLQVEEANLKLAPLPMLAVDQEVRSLRAGGVELDLRQMPDGGWNLQQLIASAAGPSTEPSRPTDPARIVAALPDVRIERTRVTITPLDGKQLVLPDVGATLERTAPLTTSFAAHVGPELTVKGDLSTLGSVPHQATITLTEPPPGLAVFLGQEALPTPIRAQLAWTGKLTREGLAGTLTINEVAASILDVRGPVDVNANNDGSLVIRPVGLTLSAGSDAATTQPTTNVATTLPTTTPAGPIALTLDAGEIRVDQRVRVTGLRGRVNEAGRVAVDGMLDPVTLDADLAAAWEDVAHAAIGTTGHFDLRARRQFTGKIRVDAGLVTTIRLPGGEAAATVVVDGEGRSPHEFDANLTIEPTAWTPAGGKAVLAPAFVGAIAARDDAIELTSLRTTDPAVGEFIARARVVPAAGTWWATLDAARLALPPLETMGLKGPIDANVSAYGDADVYVVEHLYGRVGLASAWATGAYRRNEPKPLLLDTWAWYERPDTGDGTARMDGLTAQGVVGGTLMNPLAVEAALDVRADELIVQDRKIGDIAIRIDANVTDDRVAVASREMELLGGTFALNAYRDLNRPSSPYLASLQFTRIPLARLGAIAGQTGFDGTIDEGQVKLVVPASLKLDEVQVDVTARGSELAASQLTAETLMLTATVRDGELRAMPLLREENGTLKAELAADLAMARPATLRFELVEWPAPEISTAATQPATTAPSGESTVLIDSDGAVTRPAVRSSASAVGDVTFTLVEGVAKATLTMNAGIDRDGSRLAAVSIDAAADGGVLTLDKAFVETLDGELNAKGRIDLARVNDARLDATFSRLAPAELAWLNPLIADVRGRFDGHATIAPATGPRPLGPMRIELAVRPTPDAGFRSVAIGNVDMSAFADYTSADKFRAVVDRAAIHVADGVVRPFARFSYDANLGSSQLVTVRFDRLDVDQLTRAAIDDGKPIIGRLAGTLRMYGPATSIETINGVANVDITESDLANFAPIAALYNLMNIALGKTEPIGSGNVSARIDGGTLTLLDATYFNRGVFANGFGTVRELGKLPDAPLELTLVGSAQPLKQSGNNFISQVFGTANDTFAALQSSVTSVRATGTLNELNVAPVALTELGDSVQSLLLGKTR